MEDDFLRGLSRVAHIRRLLIILALAAAAVLPATASAAFVVPDGGLRIAGGSYQREMDSAKAAGVPWVSVAARWSDLQPVAGGALGPDGPGAAAWNTLQGQVTYAHSIGLRTMVGFTSAPAWANGGSTANSAPPTADGRAAYAAFFRDLSARLGPYIDAYSPWNEVNQLEYWNPTDPAGYAELMKATYPAIKSGDPTGIVVSGSVYAKGTAFDFLRSAYAAGLKGNFDVLGWMLFSASQPEDPPPPGRNAPQPTLPSMLDVRAFLNSVDPGKPIWIVEYGYSTCKQPDYGFICVSEAQQADYLARAYTYMRRNLSVDRLFWYQMRDARQTPYLESNFGILRNDFSVKPAFAAMQSLRVTVPDSAVGGGGGGTTAKDPLGAISAPAPVLPKAAARPPDPASVELRSGRRIALGKPVLRLKKGVFTLTLTVSLKGGRTRFVVQGYRARAWRKIAATRLTRSSRITIRFRDRGFLGIRLRSTSPGTNRFVVSRVLKVPKVRIAKR